MGSQFCEHVLQVVINSELLALAVSTRLYMMVLDSAPRMESTLIWFLRPTVKGRMARSVWLFLPMRNKRQLSGRVPTDDSISGFYLQIYRITAGLSFRGKMIVVFLIDDGQAFFSSSKEYFWNEYICKTNNAGVSHASVNPSEAILRGKISRS